MSLADPCPFCESQGANVVEAEPGHEVYVECLACHARGPVAATERAAIFAWNAATRTKPPDALTQEGSAA